MQKINYILFILCAIAGASLIFYDPMPLVDLVSGARVYDFAVKWPAVRVFTEPFYAFAFYALTLNRDFYRPALISWALWVLFAAFIYCRAAKKNLINSALRLFYALLLLLTVFLFVVLLPLPGPKLLKPQGYVAADVHSHTVNSHDNISTPLSNLNFHLSQGFDSFFITEHNHTEGFKKFPSKELFKTVFPGVQMQTKDGISVLILSRKEFLGSQYKDMRLRDLIEKAHQNDMLVVMPHWWKWNKFSIAELAEMGIDGFEIYNCGYRNLSIGDQKRIIAAASKEKLLMFGSTDWHGWGYMTDVWTVFAGDKNANLYDELAKKPRISVIVYRQEQNDSLPRFIFEPFSAFYYYVKSADVLSILSFMIWIAIIFVVITSAAMKKIKLYLPFALAAFFGFLLIYFFLLSASTGGLNKIIMSGVIPSVSALCALWLAYGFIDDKFKD
jgi:predicted metal-dependent phosphoesterase TrpH